MHISPRNISICAIARSRPYKLEVRELGLNARFNTYVLLVGEHAFVRVDI